MRSPNPQSPFRHAGRSNVPELGLVALVILAYGETLRFGHVWDDYALVRLDLADALARSFDGLHVRPVWYLSYVLSQSLVASPAFEHAVNLAMFALASVLAYRLALAWLGRRGTAWTVALVWTFLPWNAYPVTWIAQRNDLLAFVFGFAAILGLWRGRYLLAWCCLALATFSKVTVASVPVYFLWRAHRRGQRWAAAGFGALLAVYLTLALRAYALYPPTAGHLEEYGWGLRLLRFPAHWLEHLALLAVPVPFFLGIGHAAVYLAGLVGVVLASAPRRRAAVPAEGRWVDPWLLALLASLAAAVTPELRICGFESLFWLLAIAQHRQWRSPRAAALALAAVLAAYGAGIAATKAIFDTRSGPPVEERGLYPTDYYRLRRQALLELRT